MEKNVFEKALGFVFLLLLLFLGGRYLPTKMHFFRLIVGLGLGYALSRAFMGFAGSVNRAFTAGSTRLMRSLMFLFVITAAVTAGLLFSKDPTTFDLWVNPINLGLLLGGLFFGFGMAFSTCCASGVLTDIVTETPKALITLLFFGIGVFLGFPVQKTQGWIQNSWFGSSERYPNGVFLPDWFKNGPLEGYLGAMLLTLVFAGLVTYLALRYERRRKAEGTLAFPPPEQRQANAPSYSEKDAPLFSKETYDRLFVQPWTFTTAAVVIMILFASLMAVTGAGWGASTPFGLWFGRILRIFGVSAESLSSFTHMPQDPFVKPFFSIPINVQNSGIIMGTLFYFLSSGQLKETLKGIWKVKAWQAALYAMGGFCMGFGTRLSNGCNVGALYTPIANFSLSGWIWLVMMVLGGILGNKVQKIIYDKKV